MRFLVNEQGFGEASDYGGLYRYTQQFQLDEPVSDIGAVETAINVHSLHSYIGDEFDAMGYGRPYYPLVDLKYSFESEQSGTVEMVSRRALTSEELETANKCIRLFQEPSETEHLKNQGTEGVIGNTVRDTLDLNVPHIYQTDFTLTGPVSDLEAANIWLEDENSYVPGRLQRPLGEDGIWQIDEVIRSVAFTLDSEDSGQITISSRRELTDFELNGVAAHINSVFSNEFAYQDFANGVTIQPDSGRQFTSVGERGPLDLSESDLDFATQMSLDEFGL